MVLNYGLGNKIPGTPGAFVWAPVEVAVVRSARGRETIDEEAGVEDVTDEEEVPVGKSEVASEDDEPNVNDFGTGIDSGANPGHATELLFALGSVRSPSGS